MSRADATHAVLYDGDCGFCKWSLDKILWWDRRGRLRAVAIQSPEGQQILSAVEPGARLESWHLVGPDGELSSGGAAAGPLACLLPGGRPLAWLFATFPGATDRAYRWVADNRTRLAGLLRIDSDRELARK